MSKKGDSGEVCILGFDPGTIITGWGAVVGKQARYVDAGAIRPKRDDSLERRLNTIFTEASGIIEQVKPNVIAVEDPFVGKNVSSALALGQARGVVLLAAARAGLEVVSYSPRAVKASIAGRGNADKEQVQFMVQRLLGLKQPPKPLDASDALAVALCHHHRGAKAAAGSTVDAEVVAGMAADPRDAEDIKRWKQGGRRRKK